MQGHIIIEPSTEVYNSAVTGTASNLPTIPINAVRAVIQVETAPIRVRFNGTDPTGGVGGGFQMVTNVDYEIEGYAHLAAMRIIRDTSTSAVINVLYKKAS